MQEIYQVPTNERVCRAFAYVALQTWSDLQDYSELGEESITDYRLLLLKRMCPKEVQFLKFSKVTEGESGADWEWWFGSGNEWFGMRVQAKRLDSKKLEYSHLDHKVGKQKKLQVDKLIEKAKKRKVYPMYCFYNYSSDNTVFANWNCKSFASRQELWGVSIADAEKIRRKVKAHEKKIAQISPISMPLMCLACCKGHLKEGENQTLPHRARGIALNLADNNEELVPNITNSLPFDIPHNSEHTFDVPEDLGGILIIEEQPDLYE